MNVKILDDGKDGFTFWKMCYVIILIAAALTIAVLIVNPYFTDGHGISAWDDVYHYYLQWLHMSNGEIPYKDFVLEYPPLAIVFIAIPGLFCFGSEDLYGVAFMIFSTAATVLCYYYLVKIGKNFGLKNRVISLMIFMSILLMTRCYLRLEMFMMLFVVMGFYFYSEKKYTLAFSMMALGTMLKLVPAIFAVAMALPFILRKDWKSLTKYIGICALICVVFTLPSLIIDADSAFDYLSYHSLRGLQLESVASSFVLLANIFVPIAGTGYSFGSTHLTGTIPDEIAVILNFVMIGVLLTFIVLSAYDNRKTLMREDNTKIVMFIGVISMMIFIGLNKVFSAQYVLWVIPLIGLFLQNKYNTGLKKEVLYLSVLCMFFTILMTFPFYPALLDLHPVAVIVLLIRNIIFCILTWKLIELKNVESLASV